MQNKFKIIIFSSLTFLLTACGFFDKDNTPAPRALLPVNPSIHPQLIWSTKTGSGSRDEYLKMTPALGDEALFTASIRGVITAVHKETGRTLWQRNTELPLAAGPGVGDGVVVVGSREGEVRALRAADGSFLWRVKLLGEVLATPAVSQHTVVVKTIDGYVHGLATNDGHERWAIQQVEPNFILRAASTPLIRDQNVIVGFANGNLTKLNLNDGRLIWIQPIAVPEGGFTIQRMIDIDANPIERDHHIYAATYQGKIASLDWTSGRILWSQDISSYTGMVADSNAVFITDAKGDIWSFNDETGSVNWHKTSLQYRTLSAPANMGRYIVVGDGEGFIHWIDKQDARVAARTFAGSSIYASPLIETNRLYVLTKKGRLLAYVL